MRVVKRTWRSHGTRILATLTTIVAGIPLLEGFPARWKFSWGVANVILGALTFGRGTVNAKNVNNP